MTRLSDTQLVLLSAACQRPDRNVLPLPANLKGGAAQKVVAGLLAKRLVEEGAAGPADPVWRTDEDGSRVTLRATNAAFQELGIEVEPEAPHSADSPSPAKKRSGKARSGRKLAATWQKQPQTAAAKRGRKIGAGTARQPRAGTKQAQLIAMLNQPDGASLDEIVAATGWQAHTVRGAIAGALKRKLGLTIGSQKVEGRGRVYRI